MCLQQLDIAQISFIQRVAKFVNFGDLWFIHDDDMTIVLIANLSWYLDLPARRKRSCCLFLVVVTFYRRCWWNIMDNATIVKYIAKTSRGAIRWLGWFVVWFTFLDLINFVVIDFFLVCTGFNGTTTLLLLSTTALTPGIWVDSPSFEIWWLILALIGRWQLSLSAAADFTVGA